MFCVRSCFANQGRLIVIVLERYTRESAERVAHNSIALFIPNSLLPGHSLDLCRLDLGLLTLMIQIQAARLPDIPEVDRVHAIAVCRHNGRGGVPQQAPRDTGEPLVLFHLGRAGLATHAFQLVLDEQLADERFAKGRDGYGIRELDFVPEHIGEGLVSCAALEGSRSEDHLVDQDAECPPVDC